MKINNVAINQPPLFLNNEPKKGENNVSCVETECYVETQCIASLHSITLRLYITNIAIILRNIEKLMVYTVSQYLSKSGIQKTLILFAVIMGSYFANAQTDPLYYKTGEDLAKKTAKYLFMKVETSKKQAYVGETIIAYYHLYVAVDIQGKLTKSPSFTGFASYDMQSGDAEAYEVKQINGIYFRVYLVKKVQLFGLRTGMQRLEPVELEATIRYRKIPKGLTDLSPSSAKTDTVINYSLKSTPVEIDIQKLPADPSASFSGAVGDFELIAYAAKNSLAAGRADTIYCVLNGSGNWHEIILPTMKWPDNMEVFEPGSSENLNPYVIPVQGLRTMAYPVVFNKKGTYVIAPVSFTYYNPILRQYKTIQSDTISITVTEAQNNEESGIPKQQDNLPSMFSRYAIIVFPVAALTLLAILFFKRRTH